VDRPVDGAIVSIARGIVRRHVGCGTAVVEVPHAFIVAVPDPRPVLLARGDGGVAVKQVNHGVGGMGERGELYPGDELPGGGAVGFDFMIELLRAGRIGSEDDVVAAGAGDVPAVARTF
jgi:hypothetical protein